MTPAIAERSAPIAGVTANGWRRFVLGTLVTGPDGAAAVARIALGIVILPHGAQHLLGAFGGFGYEGTRAWMVSVLGVPGAVASFAIALELAAPIMLVLGAGARLFAAWTAAFMLVAASTHLGNGFFMNWLGNQAGEGFEYHVLVVALAAVVVLSGAGAFSVDRGLFARASGGVNLTSAERP